MIPLFECLLARATRHGNGQSAACERTRELGCHNLGASPPCRGNTVPCEAGPKQEKRTPATAQNKPLRAERMGTCASGRSLDVASCN
ncbi:hypothetical protein BKA81DRAFT_222079 [Phyllosticta paracitricarpa]